MLRITKDHEISMAHRLVGHVGKCRNIHGHNYKISIIIGANALNEQGMIVDFSEVKKLLCSWLDDNWDHRIMLWSQDPFMAHPGFQQALWDDRAKDMEGPQSLVIVPFNPTAENMAKHLLHTVFPNLIDGSGLSIFVTAVTVQETATCCATASLE